jgi:hypothetical protein
LEQPFANIIEKYFQEFMTVTTRNAIEHLTVLNSTSKWVSHKTKVKIFSKICVTVNRQTKQKFYPLQYAAFEYHIPFCEQSESGKHH